MHNAMSMKPITLASARLIVRTPEEKDIQDIFILMNDEETAYDTGFRPMTTPSEAEGKIRQNIAKQNMFVIAEKGKPAHAIGIFEVTPETEHTTSGEKSNYHICYFLHKDARQKGYMSEVMGIMKPYLFDQRKADALTISVFPRNDASRRVALKSRPPCCLLRAMAYSASTKNLEQKGWDWRKWMKTSPLISRFTTWIARTSWQESSKLGRPNCLPRATRIWALSSTD